VFDEGILENLNGVLFTHRPYLSQVNFDAQLLALALTTSFAGVHCQVLIIASLSALPHRYSTEFFTYRPDWKERPIFSIKSVILNISDVSAPTFLERILNSLCKLLNSPSFMKENDFAIIGVTLTKTFDLYEIYNGFGHTTPYVRGDDIGRQNGI